MPGGQLDFKFPGLQNPLRKPGIHTGVQLGNALDKARSVPLFKGMLSVYKYLV